MKNNKKGFTLAELLIVVAIIAVLVAIAIPVFNAQLEKSREAVDAANIRAAYAEVMTEAISGSPTVHEVKLVQEEADWGQTFNWPANLDLSSYTPAKGDTVTLTYNATDKKVVVAKKAGN